MSHAVPGAAAPSSRKRKQRGASATWKGTREGMLGVSGCVGLGNDSCTTAESTSEWLVSSRVGDLTRGGSGGCANLRPSSIPLVNVPFEDS